MSRLVPSTAVTVVTVLYNSSGELPGFIDSIIAASADLEVDVVAVDNDSPDAATSRRIAEAAGITFVSAPTNRGYGAGVNLGVAHAPHRHDHLLVANPDISLHPDALHRLLAAADEDPGVVVLGPRILDTEGAAYPSARRSPGLMNGVGHALLGWLPGNPWSAHYRAEAEHSGTPRDADWLSGACILIDRDWFDRLGGFDERYFMYFEDVDLGERVRAAGGRNRYLPDAVVTHIGGVSTATARPAMIKAHHESAARFIDSKYPGALRWPLRAVVRAGLAIRRDWLLWRADRAAR